MAQNESAASSSYLQVHSSFWTPIIPLKADGATRKIEKMILYCVTPIDSRDTSRRDWMVEIARQADRHTQAGIDQRIWRCHSAFCRCRFAKADEYGYQFRSACTLCIVLSAISMNRRINRLQIDSDMHQMRIKYCNGQWTKAFLSVLTSTRPSLIVSGCANTTWNFMLSWVQWQRAVTILNVKIELREFFM